jgi:hypothetical protein
MSRWRVNGFEITEHKADHPPRHVHVRKDGRLIGRYDLEHDDWMEGPYHAAEQANQAVQRWREQEGI